MINLIYPKGSEWRKWDLHIHTPMSIYQRYGNNDDVTWERYIKDLESLSSDFAVLGINDYLFLDGYIRLKKEQEENQRLKNFKLLPVVEFRIDKFAGIDFGQHKRINLHVIFSDELSIETIQSQFLNTLEQSYHLASGEPWTRAITPDSVSELGKQIKAGVPESELSKYDSDLTEGFNNLNLKEDKIFESLNKDCFKGKFLIAIGKTEWGDLKWTDASIATKKSIINRADIVFTASKSVEDFVKAKQQLTYQAVNDTLLDCSDAHYFSNETDKDRIGNCFTWIKADPTFEGLKQILYEYDERVKIQLTNPTLDYEKPYFSRISISNDEIVFTDEDDLIFSKNEIGIPLNQNLVAIIGGRGEGKSMLTDYVASSFVGQSHSKEGTFKKGGNLAIEYFKTNQRDDETITFPLNTEKHAVEFLYINQGRLKNIVETKDKQTSLADSIRRLAKLNEPKFNQELNIEILSALKELHELTEFFEITDEQGNLINTLEYLKGQESSINEFINNITTQENKDKLARYAVNLGQINDLSLKKEQLTKFDSELRQIIRNINNRISNLNAGANKIPSIVESVFEPQLNSIVEWLQEISSSTESISKAIETVKEEFKDYKGDLTTLLNDIDKFQKSLFEIRKRIDDVNQKKEKHSNQLKALFLDDADSTSFISKIKKDYENQKSKLETDWTNFNKIDERIDLNAAQKNIMKKLLHDLSIEVIVDFDTNRFYDEITNSINGAVWRVKNNRQAQKDWFKINSLESFFEFIRERYIAAYNENAFYKETFTKAFFDESIRRKYIRVYPVLKYQGKDLNKISVGQKGTVYLKMMLATEAFSKPIIFDQPEDDLDNEFIMEDLIELFKNLKKYRQVIIVTHNANLVVNADAEQIIIAKNEKGKLNYSSGSLENQTINDNICKILEGGRTAFEKRRDKYKYSK
jgi:DNA repair ATPase RecN